MAGQRDVHSHGLSEGRVPGLGELVAGKYRVERVLGSGGMGAVLSARHEQLGQVVALKVLHPMACESGEAVLRFMREAQAAASLESDHVVRIFDVGTLEDGAPFMVMERLLGDDLGNILDKHGQLDVDSAVECVYQATLGVADAHAAGFVHRDLKPSNLFLTRRRDGSAWVKVLDFGISKPIADEGEEIHLTSTRAIVGSPLYMSPEQVRDSKQVDPRSDLWSLGVILHELLSGRPPFDGDTLPGVCARIAADPPAKVERADVPAGVLAVVDRCLQKEPQARFASALELAQALALLRRTGPVAFAELADEQLLSRDSAPRPSRSALSSGIPLRGAPPQVTLARDPEESARSAAADVPYEQTMSSGVAGDASLGAAGLSQSGAGGLSQSGAMRRTLSAPRDAAASVGRRRWLGGVAALIVLGSGAALWLGSARDEGHDVADARAEGAAAPALPTSVTLRIASTPSGAEAWQGERNLGRTPLELPIEPGAREPVRLQLRLEGYLPFDMSEPPPERDAELRVQLSPVPSPPPSDAPGAASSASEPAEAPADQQIPTRPVGKRPASAASTSSKSSPADHEDFGIRLKR